MNVWKEAKAAYKERKAEVIADRQHELDGRKTHRALKAVEDDRSRTSSRKHAGSRHGERRHSHEEERRRSPGSLRSGPPSPSTIYPSSQNRFSQDLHHKSTPPSPGIQRSYSACDDNLQLARVPPLPPRSYTSPPSPTIDMDLAYGEYPGPLTTNVRQPDKIELEGLIGKVKRLLEEADCLHYSASATIAMLQKNPEAMAAVALTLAEISNIASKMAPGALAGMKGGAPAVFALLASPQFLIAGGVAVGITIVAFGGYKIIKKIRAKHALEDPGMDEMLEIGSDVSTIDNWRRGIAEEQAHSVGTSVDGEFITPQAAALSRLNLAEHRSSSKSGSKEKKMAKSASKSVKDGEKASRASSKASSKAASSKGSSKESSKDGSSTAGSKTKKEKEKKVKKPSPLRLMFQ